jgi:hypothetical protein
MEREIAQEADNEKIHRYTSISSDLLQFSQIEKLVDSKVKELRVIRKSLNSINKNINSLRGKNDPDSLKKLEELQKNLEEKNREYSDYDNSISSGEITEIIISELKKNPRDPLSENSLSKDKIPPRDISLSRSIQMMVEKKFLHDLIKIEYSRKNIDYYLEINNTSDSENLLSRL